jgi:hypothetical protein
MLAPLLENNDLMVPSIVIFAFFEVEAFDDCVQ